MFFWLLDTADELELLLDETFCHTIGKLKLFSIVDKLTIFCHGLTASGEAFVI